MNNSCLTSKGNAQIYQCLKFDPTKSTACRPAFMCMCLFFVNTLLKHLFKQMVIGYSSSHTDLVSILLYYHKENASTFLSAIKTSSFFPTRNARCLKDRDYHCDRYTH